MNTAPGSWRRPQVRWGRFDHLARSRPDGLVIADERVLRLHPHVRRALAGATVISLRAGEAAKSLGAIARLATNALTVSRDATVVSLGGGTIGDLSTVFAHVLKRGVRLIHVPTTLLAAVDSSVGGKGALNVGGVKNALGAFHFPDECWVCPELFGTLREAQRREGRLEAWKVALLDAPTWRSWCRTPPEDQTLIRTARALKERICAADPYEQTGVRTLLNFGHTFAHVVEAVSHFRVRHGEAVGLGMLCALDVGQQLDVTAPLVAREVEAALPNRRGARSRLRRVLAGVPTKRLEGLLRADKKGSGRDGVAMVLLERPGRLVVRTVPWAEVRRAVARWVR